MLRHESPEPTQPLRTAAATVSLLAKATPGDVAMEPFPHLVVRDALDPEVADRLLHEMPAIETLTGGRVLGSNQRVSYPFYAAREDASVSPTWKRFLGEHVSPRFLVAAMRLFGPALRQLHPRFEEKCAPVDRLRAGVRGIDGYDGADVLLDAQICANSPVVGRASSVRGAHVDAPDKLLIGLYYLRDPRDDSTGGDLQLYGPRTPSVLRLAGPNARERFTLRRTVRYEHNVLVQFLNAIDSVHLVTPRSPTSFPRLLVNLIGEVKDPLWQYQGRAYDRLRQRLVWNSAMVMRWGADSAADRA
jgi:hypothetical protein